MERIPHFVSTEGSRVGETVRANRLRKGNKLRAIMITFHKFSAIVSLILYHALSGGSADVA